MSTEDETKSKNEQAAVKTLGETDVVSGPAMGRRAALLAIGGTALGGAAAVSSTLSACIVRTAPAQPVYYTQPQQQQTYVVQETGYQRVYSGQTDGDAGSYADPAGYGRGSYRGVQTGLTDSDNGSGGIQDPAGQGRGHHGRPGWQSGVTDSDGGQYADPAGNGRGRYRGSQTGITDADSGPNADAAGQGRGRWR